MLRIAKIISLIFMIIFLLAGIGTLLAAAVFVGFALLGIFPLLFFVINLVIWMQIGGIQSLVQQGQYARAKEKTFLWMILGLILGGILIGIFLILAYIKFDPVINWQRSAGQAPQAGWGAPPAQQPQSWGQPSQPQGGWSQPGGAQPAQGSGWSSAPVAAPAPAPAPAPAAAPAAPQAVNCPKCGKPATWIAQYSRWYCYSDAQYV